MSLAVLESPQILTRPAIKAALRFEVLDSWRGICALLVALFHFPLAGPVSENAFVRGSFLFVDFFFVLSGFVIAHAYAARVSSGEGFAKFMITRFGRLFPLHAFMLAAFVGFELFRLAIPRLAGGQAAFTGAFSLDMLPANLALLHGLGIHDHLSWNAPSWSISTELFAYLFFGLVLLLLKRFSLFAFAAAALAGPVLLYFLSPDFMDATYDFGLVRCLFGFSAGVLTHHALAGSVGTSDDTKESRLAWTLAEIAVVLAVILFVSTSAASAGGLLAPFIFAFAVAVFAHEGGAVSRLLRWRPFLLLGTISYSIYLTHIFVQSRMMNAAKLLDGRLGLGLLEAKGDVSVFAAAHAAPMIAIMVLAVIAVSLATYHVIEAPGRDFFRRLVGRVGMRT